MAALILPSRRVVQPQGPLEIDWSHPFNKSITHCIPLNGCPIDVVTKKKLTLTNGVFRADSKGFSLRGNGTQSCASIPLNLSAYKNLTVSFWLYWAAFASDDDFAFELTPDTNANDGGIAVDPNSGTSFQVYTRITSTASGQAINITRPTAGEWHHYQISLNRTISSGASVFIDGLPASFTYFLNLSGTSSFANSTLYLFSRNNASLFGSGRLQNLVFRGGFQGDGALAEHEYRNPWSLYKPQAARLWSVAAAGGGTDALTSQPISTGAPTVTQAALGQTHALTSQAIDTAAPTLTQAAIGQIHALASQAISTAAPTITAPALTSASTVDNLIALALSTGAITMQQATLAQIHVLTAQGISTDAPTISTPALTAAADFDNLTATDIVSGAPTVSSPVIGQIHMLTGLALVTGAPTVTRAVLVGDIPDYTPAIDIFAVPVGSYAFTVPVGSYAFTVPADNHSF